MKKKALVCGAGGFIGGHLVNRLKSEGYWVRGVDLKENEYDNNAKRIQNTLFSSLKISHFTNKS